MGLNSTKGVQAALRGFRQHYGGSGTKGVQAALRGFRQHYCKCRGGVTQEGRRPCTQIRQSGDTISSVLHALYAYTVIGSTLTVPG